MPSLFTHKSSTYLSQNWLRIRLKYHLHNLRLLSVSMPFPCQYAIIRNFRQKWIFGIAYFLIFFVYIFQPLTVKMILMTYVTKFKNYNPTFTSTWEYLSTASMYEFIGSNFRASELYYDSRIKWPHSLFLSFLVWASKLKKEKEVILFCSRNTM